MIAFSLVGCKIEESGARRYKGYVGVPIRARQPMSLYVNENHQFAPGRGYVLASSSESCFGAIVARLPAGQTIQFDHAYNRIINGGHTVWLEGYATYRGHEYGVQKQLSLDSEIDDIRMLQKLFNRQ